MTLTLCAHRVSVSDTKVACPKMGKRVRNAIWAVVVLAHGLCLSGASAHPFSSGVLRLPFQRMGSLYSAALAKNPILTHCVQGASISGIGDLACQTYAARHDHVEKGLRPHTLSLEQAVGAASTGVLFGGLLIPAYYHQIQAILPSRHPAAVALKVAIDGAIWGFAGNFLLVGLRGILEGGAPKESMSYASSVIWPVFKNDCALWIPYNALCYGAIPKALQPLSTASVSALWAAYISYVSVEEKRQHAKDGAQEW